MPDYPIIKNLTDTNINDKQNISIAILFLCGFSFLAAVLDTHAKFLTQTLPITQVTWARYFFHTALIAPIVLYLYGINALKPPQMTKQIVRGTLLFISTLLYFLAIARIQLAETQTLVFSSPLIVTMFSPLLLSEKIGIHRWSAVIIGFIGVIVVLNPTLQYEIKLGALAAFLAGVFYAFYMIITRQLMHSPPMITLLFTGIVGTTILTLTMPFVWQNPTPLEWLLMVTLGVCGACSHLCIIQAFRRASASQLSPWIYVKLLFTTASGYFLFKETPTLTTWIGASIIIASGIYIWRREQILAKRRISILEKYHANS